MSLMPEKKPDMHQKGRASSPWARLAAAATTLQRNAAQCAANLQASLSDFQQQQQQQRYAAASKRSRTVVAAQAASLTAAVSSSGPASLSAAAPTKQQQQQQQGHMVSQAEVGRATWVFLHTLAAQYPERPSRQQRRDVRNLLDILTRMYPCADCAQHFKQLCADSPPAVGSRRELQRWMCEAHNSVNRRLGKPTFNCALVEARWSGLDCGDDAGCSLELGRRR